MLSLFDELTERIQKDPSLIRRSGPRQDLGLLLFAERKQINELWKAASACLARNDDLSRAALDSAVEKLKPLFGER